MSRIGLRALHRVSRPMFAIRTNLLDGDDAITKPGVPGRQAVTPRRRDHEHAKARIHEPRVGQTALDVEAYI